MRKLSLIVIALIIICVTVWIGWNNLNKSEIIDGILNDFSKIDSIIIKDGQSNKKILTLTDSDPSFSDMVEPYRFYYDIKWSERVLLSHDPLVTINYIDNNKHRFTISVFEVKNEHITKLPEDVLTDVKTYSYRYTLKEDNSTYIFAIKEINQLISVNEGLKELLNHILSKGTQ